MKILNVKDVKTISKSEQKFVQGGGNPLGHSMCIRLCKQYYTGSARMACYIRCADEFL